MELKDVILSTLDEIEKSSGGDEQKVQQNQKEAVENFAKPKEQNQPLSQEQQPTKEETPTETKPREAEPPRGDTVNEHFELNATKDRSEEIKYLENMRERLLVLFEGFQSPNNQNLEAKLDLTINFLEYVLSTLDERLDRLKKH